MSRQQPATTNAIPSPAATSVAQAPSRPLRVKPTAAPRTASPAGASSRSSSAAILAQIHQADLKEITIGKIADEKASGSEVRQYADRLVKDHTTIDQTIVETAQRMSVGLHDISPLPRHERAHTTMAEERLESANGATFDRLFLQQTSSDHNKLIGALKQEREDASDDDIEALIDKILPILEQHEQLAQILLKKEGA